MNHLVIGTADKTARFLELARPPFLLIDDGPIADAFLTKFPKARSFAVARHSFNPLRGIDYKRARDFAAALYTANPEGANTLTVRNGKRALLKLLLGGTTRLDKLPSPGDDPGLIEAVATVEDLLLSPVLRQVLCRPTNFSFKGAVVVKLDRASLGDFDCFVLASLLIGQSEGHVIVPDFGFYGRDFYVQLVRQERLIAGLDLLSSLPAPLQQTALSIKDKTVYRTTREDAERLSFYVGVPNPSQITDLPEGKFLSSQ